MHFTSEQRSDEIVERTFRLGDIPGVLWTPASTDHRTPLLLLGHPGGLGPMHSRLVGRAQRAVQDGFASIAVELPGSGDRRPIEDLEDARADLWNVLRAGGRPSDELVDRLVLPLVERAVPEWRAVIDAALSLPEIDGPVGYSGGFVAIGVGLVLADPRVVAAGLFAGSYIPRSIHARAHGVTIPLHVLLQWDDEGHDRRAALDLFDAFGSREKTLQANLGGHRGVPSYAGEDAARFFVRHMVA